ncbi:MAG TPA: DUF6744 family protein, partial [Polyangia bacterium]|nr:DUF6744 family protein [Polyangia bacterium]
MQTELDLIRRNTNHGGQPLGDLLWWELAAASVNRPDLVKLWVQGGLPTELLPEEPTAEKAFKTAARETQVGHPDRLFRLAMENEQEIVIGIVNELRDGTGGLIYIQEARVTLERQAGKLVSDQPRHDLVAQLVQRFEELKTVHTTDDIRRTITRTLDSFAAVTLRHGGGVYWTPALYAASLRRLQGVIEKLGQSRMHLVPVTATKEGQAALAQAAKASIEEELTALQTEMQQFLQTPPDRASTLMRRLEHFDDLRRKANLYQTVLQAQVE